MHVGMRAPEPRLISAPSGAFFFRLPQDAGGDAVLVAKGELSAAIDEVEWFSAGESEAWQLW